jgi:hypothetical protein
MGMSNAATTGAAIAAAAGWRRTGGVGCNRQFEVSGVGRVFGQPGASDRAQAAEGARREQLAPALAAWRSQAAVRGRHSRTSAGSEAAMAKSEKARTAGRRIAGIVQQDACPVPYPVRQPASAETRRAYG